MECSVVVHALLPGGSADEAFAKVADFAQYPAHTSSVREVRVRELDSGEVETTWEVNFRKGVLVWTERDAIDADSRRIEFAQTTGDFANFTGSWLVVEAGSDVRVEFASRFDLGIASLASLVDPVACAALRDGIRDILLGLFGDQIEVHDIEAAPVLAGAAG